MSDRRHELEVLEGGQHAELPPVRRRPRDPLRRRCHHLATELDVEERRVYCSSCGVEVPAFDALVTLSSRGDEWRAATARAERDARAAQRRLDELKRDERNARARLRRLET